MYSAMMMRACRSPAMSIRSVHSARAVAYEPGDGVHTRLAGQLRGPGSSRERVTPSRCICRESARPQTPHTVASATVGSRCGRSPPPEPSRRVRARKVRQRSCRTAGGGIRCGRKILRMVPAPIRRPRRRSSPWTRITPSRDCPGPVEQSFQPLRRAQWRAPCTASKLVARRLTWEFIRLVMLSGSTR